MKSAGEELPVDGVDRSVRHLDLDLASARDGDGNFLALQLLDGIRGVAFSSVTVGPPRLHHVLLVTSVGSRLLGERVALFREK